MTTTFILTFPLGEDEDAFQLAVTAWCQQRHEAVLIPMRQGDQKYVSGLTLPVALYVGAHTDFHLTDFLSFLRSYKWREPDEVQLFVNGPRDTIFAEVLQATRPRVQGELRHPDEMAAQGFVIDTHCYPPLAYKGPRFRPTETYNCYTRLESKLIRRLERKAA